MANNRWLSKAAPVKQVTTVTIANTWATSDTITLTIDSVDFIVTIGTNGTRIKDRAGGNGPFRTPCVRIASSR